MSARSRSRRRAPLVLRLGAQVAPVDGKEIERHERGRRLLRQLRHARRRGVKAQLERIEIETVRCRDHDLTIDNAVIWQGRRERRHANRESSDRADASRGFG